jgi:hypothetical protein
LVAPLFLSFLMALQLDIDVLRPEGLYKCFDGPSTGFLATFNQSGSQWALISTCQAYKA